MNREQAVAVIKQIFEKCSRVEGKSIKLLAPNANGALSDTFQIHIQTREDELLQSCIMSIAKDNNLAVKRKGSLFVIYKRYANVKMAF